MGDVTDASCISAGVVGASIAATATAGGDRAVCGGGGGGGGVGDACVGDEPRRGTTKLAAATREASWMGGGRSGLSVPRSPAAATSDPLRPNGDSGGPLDVLRGGGSVGVAEREAIATSTPVAEARGVGAALPLRLSGVGPTDAAPVRRDGATTDVEPASNATSAAGETTRGTPSDSAPPAASCGRVISPDCA
jgi:hypothetical protein